jgi:hypothetical protein
VIKYLPALAAVLAVAACGGSSLAAPAASPASSSAAPVASAAEADTAAAAQSAASGFFALYAAGQYAAAYPMLDAQARATVSEPVWAAVHQACKSSTSGLSYKIGAPVVAGSSAAVMSVSLAGAASAIGSEEETFVYQGGKWAWSPAASDLAAYKGGNVQQIVGRLKTAGNC